jgi:hypothetical protein
LFSSAQLLELGSFLLVNRFIFCQADLPSMSKPLCWQSGCSEAMLGEDD